MGLEQVKQEVLSKAEKKASQIIGEAKAEAGKIESEAVERLKQKEKQAREEARAFIDAIRKKELSSANLEVKNELLNSKKNIVENAFEEARKEMKNLSHEKQRSVMARLLEKAMQEIDVAHVYASAKGLKLLDGKFSVEEADMLGGIMAENKDRTVRVDYSFDSILEHIKQKSMGEIGKILFGGK